MVKSNGRNKKNGVVTRRVVSQMVRNSLLAQAEIKRFSINTASYAGSTAGTITPLTQSLLPGDTISGRTANVISPRSLEMNISVILPATGTTAVVTRFIVFQDMLNTGTAVVVADVLDGSVYNSSHALYPFQQRRFRILTDRSVSSAIGASNMAQQHELRFKMKGKIFYNADTNVAAANGAGSIWILTINSSAGAGTQPNIAFFSSLTYTDV